ncbi:MAG: TolC family protein [Flavobacteriales bacterium]|nr:TolC family protein [Flavobacteriales bacterium]
MIKFSLTILVVAATALSFAQTDSSGTAFTLAQAQEYAVTNSYRAQQAKAQVLITIKKKKEIRAIGLPQVNGAVKFQNFLDIPTTLVPANAFNPLAPEGEFAELQFGTDYTTSAGVTASQILFDGSYLIGLKLADDYTGLYTQQEEKTLIQVKDDVARAYYAALVAFETRELLQATLVSMQHTLVELQQMNTQGFIEELAVDQQELQVSNLQNNISSIDRQIDMGLKLLKINMGLDIDEKITLTEDLETILASLNYEDLANQNFSVENNVDYRLLQTNQNIMKLSLQNEQFANLPSLSAFLTIPKTTWQTISISKRGIPQLYGE